MLQVDHIAAAHLQKTILGQNGRQLLQLAVKGAEMFPRNVPYTLMTRPSLSR